MNDNELWNTFINSGRVEDYLKYKCETNCKKEEKPLESYNDKRSDYQGTEGWRG